MSEFGAVRCQKPGCRVHDFLPLVCQACGRTFCSEHFEFEGHGCPKGDDYLAKMGASEGASTGGRASHPLATQRPSELMAAVTTRFEGREGELNVNKAHYNVKTSDKGENDRVPDKHIVRAQKIAGGASSAKEKRVSSQVHRMLIKSRAVGDKKLRVEDRFFLEVHYSGNDRDCHYMYFSRLWTVGRALDTILQQHRSCIRSPPAREDEPLELACERSGESPPLGGVLADLSPSLQPFDKVTVQPRGASRSPDVIATTPSENGAEQEAAGSSSRDAHGGAVAEEAGKRAWSSSMPPGTRGTLGTDVGSQQEGGAYEGGVGADGAMGVERSGEEEECSQPPGERVPVQALEEAGGDAAGPGSATTVAISVRHGKTVHSVGGIDPATTTVVDLKRRLEALSGVPFNKQKLVYKGILRDGALLCDAGVGAGVKVMLLGSAATPAQAGTGK